MRGQTPFSNRTSFDEICGRAELDEESIAYVRKVIVVVERQGMLFKICKAFDPHTLMRYGW